MAVNESELMAAELLRASSTAFAAYASSHLLEKRPDAKLQFGEMAFGYWKDHFTQRVNELSAAMAEKETALFLSRIRWSRAAFQARDVPEDLLRESLVCLGEVLEEELPETCRQAPTKYIDAALNLFDQLENNAPKLDSKDPTTSLAMQYLLQVLEGNSSNAIKMVVDAHDKGQPLEDTYQVLMTAQREIGRMWHYGEINIAEEHIVTSTTQRAMSVLAYLAKKQTSNGLTVVSAAVSGNAHDMGVRLVSDFFEIAGWRSVCLGADLPAADIAQAVKFFDTSLVLLSAALSTQLKAVRETIQAIRESDTKCKIMVGGTALSDAPEIWRQLGADAYAASPSEAIKIGTLLVEQP